MAKRHFEGVFAPVHFLLFDFERCVRFYMLRSRRTQVDPFCKNALIWPRSLARISVSRNIVLSKESPAEDALYPCRDVALCYRLFFSDGQDVRTEPMSVSLGTRQWK